MDETVVEQAEELDIEIEEEGFPTCLWDEETGDILLPRGFRETDNCPTCGEWNKVAEVLVEEDCVIMRYHCDCGNIHGIVREGVDKVERYVAFIEEMLTQPEEEKAPD
jgi:transcription elongation factor Elf1